jgi:hypothetical protein
MFARYKTGENKVFSSYARNLREVFSLVMQSLFDFRVLFYTQLAFHWLKKPHFPMSSWGLINVTAWIVHTSMTMMRCMTTMRWMNLNSGC